MSKKSKRDEEISYENMFKLLDDRLSVECFVDLHKECYDEKCECACHTKRESS